MQATLLTEWQCSLLNLLKIWVQHVKTIPGNLLLTVKMIIQQNEEISEVLAKQDLGPLRAHLSLPASLWSAFWKIIYCTQFLSYDAIQFHFVGSSHSLSSVVHASNIDIKQLVIYYYFSVPLLPTSLFRGSLTRFFFTLVFKMLCSCF